ncbi:MAG TPA: hypothetical protein VK112_11870 [Fodinibius sp.]|nr:hypothetical protein [Fodinibius sp.]
MIAPYFLPRRRVGSLRPFKFAIHLQNFGWEPHIITIASDGQLTRKEQKLLKDISVYQLDPPFDYTSGSGSQLQKKDERSQNNNFGLNDWIDKQFPVDTWLPFFMLKYQRIRKIVRTVNPDAIWSTGDPWSAHWVGRAMACLDPGRFWIADFRDPWTLSQTDLKKRSSFSAGIDRKMERRLINSASMVSFTTDSTRRLYENHYKDLDLNTTTIYNAFDRLLFDGSGPESIDLAMDVNHLNVVFFGKFRRLSPAKPLIDILSQLKITEPSAAERIRVHSFGNLSKEDARYAAEKQVKECFKVHDPVPVEQGLQVLQQADLQLLSTNPERTDIIPAKFWDYLAARKPILSIAPNPEIKEILQQTGTGEQYHHSDLKQLAILLKSCVEAKKADRPLPISFSYRQDEVEQYSAKSATRKLATVLDEHIQ